MNLNSLKNYAPQARRDFIQAMTDRAAYYGLTAKTVEPVVERGDVAVIAGREHPRAVARKRKALEDRIQRQGFAQTMEALAYTWFNRLVAIRFMELHGYLDHGYRILSPSPHRGEGRGEGATPEILEHAEHVELPGLRKEAVIDSKLAGNQERALYRLLLLAQCNALHQAMPFLFEAIGDETELLLPTNLLHTDSLIRHLVEDIPEEDWADIEIIGWLYQFYIAEKKDQVIGKVVKSEDIPAATQLFTPNWIVKYMVQNSLGAQWLATYPQSPLKGQMAYYIEPAEQTDQVKAQLAAITPSHSNPEELTLIDPASGSGHILVEAYELFKAIYLERGYRQRDIPQLILEKNLFGLDIDGRAAQLTGFALMMKGRADDRRLFERGVKLNVMALVGSAGFDAEALAKGVEFSDYGLKPGDLAEGLKRLFEHATTFGSLIQVPRGVAEKLPSLKQLSEATSQDLFVSEAFKRLGPLVQQAEMLAAQYDAVVANPPYMGSKFYCPALKAFVNTAYKAGNADLYGAFTLRNMLLAQGGGHVGMITIPNWMFLSSFESLRSAIFRDAPIGSLVHNGRGVWGSDFGSCSYVLKKSSPERFNGCFLRLFDKQGSVASNEELERRFHTNPRFTSINAEFGKIPGSPVAYWVSEHTREIFGRGEPLSSVAKPRVGMRTGDNERFLRQWHEVSFKDSNSTSANASEASDSGKKWFPFVKGGDFRKWFGNIEQVVNWADNGHEIKQVTLAKYPQLSWDNLGWKISNETYYFRSAITWTAVSSSCFGVRFVDEGNIFGTGGSCIFPDGSDFELLGALLCSNVGHYFMGIGNPTLNINIEDVAAIPILGGLPESVNEIARTCRVSSCIDWNAYERSWDFQSLPILTASSDPTPTLESSYTAWITQNRDTIAEMKRLEEENNRLFIDAYGLADELTPDVPIEQITLTVNPAYRYGGKLSEEEQWTRFRQDTMAELISYAIGCMMGRYSLDAPGLIYAHSGNEGFDPSQYPTFRADDDGIIPLLETDWGFPDDATNRIVEFIGVAWPKTSPSPQPSPKGEGDLLEANLKFIADSLGPNNGEQPRDTIRRYLATGFYKHHLTTYKRRPIYWLFSSGKQRAFQCLVYLHRHHIGTLARMRTEYVIPLQGQIAARIDQLENDKAKATSTSYRKKLQKEQDDLKKQQAELLTFEEKLKHAADQKICLDLDDGVKVNYGKFGDLLAESKAICGAKEED